MLKKFLPLLPVLLLAGCATATFTRLTPGEQPRNAINHYAVETAFDSQQQSLRADSIKAYVLVNGQALPLRPVPLEMWHGNPDAIRADAAWRPAYWMPQHRAICAVPKGATP